MIGWTLATPSRPPLEVGAPGGTGGIGAAAGNGGVGTAPERAAPRPVTTVKFTPQPGRSAAAKPPIATAPSAAPTATTAPPVKLPTESESTLPVLDQPPVPTPTEITVTPSASESGWFSVGPTDQEPNSP
ncbi:hypothetical protein [Actinoplanes sp. NPDC026619]|uniref:hypothetical protein n=1 Tax=Actinoplanes sp. NPDC026619 TaxID=3155798 RepID=UPI0033DAD974